MNSNQCRGCIQIAALLVAAVTGCDLLEPPARTRSTTSAARPAPLAESAASGESPSRLQPVENTTAAATEEAAAHAPPPCAATEFNYPVVQEACARDGRRAAKNVMRGAIAKAKSAGVQLECNNCHQDQVSFGLRPNAVEDIAKWL